MVWWEMVLLVAGGFVAAIVNTMAGGGSALTVPLLVLAGVEGNAANGSNRVGILTSNAMATASFRRLGVLDDLSKHLPVLLPVVVGSLAGSMAISRITDEGFETVFGLIMVPIVILSVRPQRVRTDASAWPVWVTVLVFFAIGVYGGAIQAGVGLVLLAALTRSGFDLVTANGVKVLVNTVVTLTALPVFIIAGDVRWGPALLLATGFTAGGWAGAHLSVRGGEKWIRALVVVAALALAASLLDFY